ncbi:YihY/virulence factor BrkB family protein [Staphylococcus americanisciuri]|uniref:YihY/virulence factor BrkB family protein n=1 Tax=Staphylococcus americanisciuri TaxID=2973940 RepID=A0ABT2F4I5_9STAP|nr:YihY/virulence factor BrkB family protein [Staphylococcus americanisciuri]MCS4487295.1 YihY/virulence factor BrkB family protein [Staphylococcus americanisciuri]
MAEKQDTSESFVDKLKNKIHKSDANDETTHHPDRKGDASGDVEAERHFVKPQPFQSKEAPKDNETFFVSRINKPVKYSDRPGFIKYLIYRISKDDASGLAAQLAYYFMLSLFPMLIFVLSLVPVFNIDRQTLIDQISENAPADAASIITSIIDDIMGNASGSILSIGLILALWTASNGMTAMMNAFNVAYDVEDSRNFIVSKALAVLFTLALGITLPITMVLFTFGEQIGNLLFGSLGLDDQVRWIFSLLRTALPVIAIFIVFTLLYTAAPNVKIKLKSVLPGSLFATIVWIVGTLGFGYYVSNFGNYSKTYGSIGGVIVLMLWLYITGFILIIGAEINAIVHQRKVVKGKTPEEQTYDELEESQEQDLAKAYNNYEDNDSERQDEQPQGVDTSVTSSSTAAETSQADYTAPQKVERENDGYSRHIKTTKDQ